MEARSIAKTIVLVLFIPTIPNSSVLFLVLSKSAWSRTEVGVGGHRGQEGANHFWPPGSLSVLVLSPH